MVKNSSRNYFESGTLERGLSFYGVNELGEKTVDIVEGTADVFDLGVKL